MTGRLDRVVRTMDNAIHRIKHSHADNVIDFRNTYRTTRSRRQVIGQSYSDGVSINLNFTCYFPFLEPEVEVQILSVTSPTSQSILVKWQVNIRFIVTKTPSCPQVLRFSRALPIIPFFSKDPVAIEPSYPDPVVIEVSDLWVHSFHCFV